MQNRCIREPDRKGMPPREVYSVSKLNREAKQLLERELPAIWLEGEVSNVSRPTSGHLYFCLKDATAQVRCALFRGQARHVVHLPQDGQSVLVHAQVTLYEGRGDFQLIVEQVEEAGEGALRRAFEALKRRLAAEGLFAENRKRALPRLPRRIGIITSTSGAALHDILTTLGRRFPAVGIVIYAVPVQGTGAAERIAQALRRLPLQGACDVLILARGGGSLEDLWSFNEEVVARAIGACTVPVVTGIGHETDITIADLVADKRGATPTAAAELVTPDGAAWLQQATDLGLRLRREGHRFLTERAQRLDHLIALLPHPAERVQTLAKRLTDLHRRLHQSWRQDMTEYRHQLERLEGRLSQASPRIRLSRVSVRLAPLVRALPIAVQHQINRKGQQLQRRIAALRPPRERMERSRIQLEHTRKQLEHCVDRTLIAHQHRVHDNLQRMGRMRLTDRIRAYQNRAQEQQRRLLTATGYILHGQAQVVSQAQGRLKALGPQNTVKLRGYSILVRADDSTIIRQRDQVRPGDYVRAYVGDGQIRCIVEATDPQGLGFNDVDRKD